MVEIHPISCRSASEGECQSFNRLSWQQVLLFFHENLNTFVFLLTWSKIKFQNIQILHETALRLSLEPQLFLLAMINPTCMIKRIFFLEKKVETFPQTKSITSFFVGKNYSLKYSSWKVPASVVKLLLHSHQSSPPPHLSEFPDERRQTSGITAKKGLTPNQESHEPCARLLSDNSKAMGRPCTH